MPVSRTFDLPDENATQNLGRLLADLAQPGDIILLMGTLGMGKSTLARAFIQALTSEDEDVPSPTFTLAQTYDADCATLWHFDLYRLEHPEDAFELGLEEAFIDGISLIEWPERLGPYRPRRFLEIALNPGQIESSRTATLTSHSAWDTRLLDLTWP